jgi:hypothetical protein
MSRRQAKATDAYGCRLRVIDEVMGTEKTRTTKRGRDETVKAILAQVGQSKDCSYDGKPVSLDEPLGCCVYIRPTEIVWRWYVNGSDPAAARAALAEIREKEGDVI